MNVKTLCLLVVILALCVPAAAQADHGQRFNYMALTAATAARTFDTYRTCRVFSAGGREDLLPTQSCAGVAGFNAGFLLGGVAAHILTHKTGHHRWESVGHFLVLAGAAEGIAYQYTHNRHVHGFY